MLREFTDSSGTTWRVWDVYPAKPVRRGAAPDDAGGVQHLPATDLGEGWLCFQCDGEKRRLAPIPPTWEICDCAALESLCEQAGYSSKQ